MSRILSERCAVWLALLCGALLQARASDVPYSPDEVAQLRAFLQCESMVAGKSNAEVLGADLDRPETWAGVSWVDYDPYVDINLPRVPLAFKHVLNIDFRNTLAGSLEVNGFAYLQLCWIMNTAGKVGSRGKYTSIRVKNNPKCSSVYLDYIEAGSVEIGGNPSLTAVHLRTSAVGLLNLSAPSLSILRAGTLGDPPLNFAAYPELSVVDLAGIANVTTLDFSGCPKLGALIATEMKNVRTIRWGGGQNVVNVDLSDNESLTSLDLRQMPKLGILKVADNNALTNLLVGGSPELDTVRVNGNPSLTSCELVDLPSVRLVDCGQNKALKELILRNDPKLTDVHCQGNGLQTLDVSGLTALSWLLATGNEIAHFKAPPTPLTNLSLSLNKLQSIEVNVAGYPIRATAYKGGGYVNLDASFSAEDWSKFFISFDVQGLPKPRDTKFQRTEGSGLPDGYDWEDRFPLTGAVDATFYFGAVVTVMSYFERAEDNPWGDWFGTANPIVAIVGDPLASLNPPARKGFTLQGWYTDEAMTQPWDLERDVVQGEMTLFPNWVPDGAPRVLSLQRLTPASEQISTNRVVYRVRFSEVVSGVDPSDFTLATTGTATGRVAGVSADHGDTIDIAIDGIAGSGTLRLDLNAVGTQIVDANAVPLTGGFTQGETYRVVSAADLALADFLQAHGIDPTGVTGSATADPDRDGLSNLLEFVLHGEPAVADPSVKPLAQYRGGSFVYRYTLASLAEPLYRVVVESSADLLHWSTVVDGQDGVTIATQPTDGGTVATVTFAGARSKVFVRLRVEAK